MIRFLFAKFPLIAALALLVACSANGNTSEINPKELAKQMFVDQGITLPPFTISENSLGEYGSVDLIKNGNISISLAYQAGDAYNKDDAPASGSELLSGVKGAYSYCVVGMDGNLDGDPQLMHLAVPDLDRLIVTILHPADVTTESKSAHLPEVRQFVNDLYTQKGGAKAGTFRDGSPTTYYVYGGWLWRGEASDNAVLLCAYPIIHQS
jgi:hypothetical protein